MKKLLLSFCCFIILISIIGCNNKKSVREDNNKDRSSEEEELKADINNLFADIQEIESIATMRIDIQYTLETMNQIEELMKLLEDIEYTEYAGESINEDVKEKEESTGSSTNGISLVFYYKNDSRKILEFSSNEESELVEYTEVSYKPYTVRTGIYTIDVQVWDDVLKIMKKGNMKDLNEK